MRAPRKRPLVTAVFLAATFSSVLASGTAATDGEPSTTVLPPVVFPTFKELHSKLFGIDVDDSNNDTHVVASFSNPYDIRPNFNNYPHSNLLPAMIASIFDIVAPIGGPRFIVEVGSLHGHSAIQMATVLDYIGLEGVPILCIDPFTGDTNMWAAWQTDAAVGKWVKLRDGRMTVFDQFMANVQFAMTRTLTPHHVLPFQATSTVGARWLKQMGYTPDLIFLDSAHEEGETFLEISMYFDLLLPGGILFGDDYGWPAVKHDVNKFVEQHNARHMVDNPIDFQITRAKEGVSNMLWIMRKAIQWKGQTER